MRALATLLCLLLLPTAGLAQAGAGQRDATSEGSGEAAQGDAPDASAEDAEPAVSEAEREALKALTQDALGRPFPHPDVLKRVKQWQVGGYVLTGTGAALSVVGITLGTQLARDADLDDFGDREPFEDPPPPRAVGIGLLSGVGGAMLLSGIPLASAGDFSVRQMKRTIKGAEKVPRTVANELRYWQAYRQKQYGQALSIGGGGSLAMGLLSTVAVGALVGTDRYDPRYWAFTAIPWGAGVGLLVGGLRLGQVSKQQMEAVRDEVDPMRQTPTLGLRFDAPIPTVSQRDGAMTVGMVLSGSF